MQRSDAVAVRRADEAAMLAWLDRQPGADALEADIEAAQALIAGSHAGDEASQLFAQIRGRTQLLSAAYRLQRLALERGKPDAERERGYQQRDEARIKAALRSEEHTSELQSLMRISYADFCLKKKKRKISQTNTTTQSLVLVNKT